MSKRCCVTMCTANKLNNPELVSLNERLRTQIVEDVGVFHIGSFLQLNKCKEKGHWHRPFKLSFWSIKLDGEIILWHY